MVDSIDHWATVCICSTCGKIPESLPIFHCPAQHQYCSDCFQNLKKNYRGTEENGCFCNLCQTCRNFRETRISPEFLRKLKSGPGIGRPFRYNSNPLTKTTSIVTNSNNGASLTKQVTVENLFGLPKSDLNKLFENKNHGDVEERIARSESEDSINTTTSCYKISPFSSHKPVVCPHFPCSRMIAISSFASHFRYDHPELKKYSTERNREILIPFDISTCECGKSFCLAILTMYEANKVDLLKSRSTHSVIKTCRKFCQKVPIDSFWLMMSGSKSRRKLQTYVLIWLFTNSAAEYYCTIELSSKNDNVSFSTFSKVNGIPENSNIEEIAINSNCLYIGYGSAAGLLREGSELNLRIAVH